MANVSTTSTATDAILLRHQLVALIIQLPAKEIEDLPAQLEKALQNDDFISALQQAILMFSLQNGKSPENVNLITPGDQNKVQKLLAQKPLMAFENQLQKQVENSSQFKAIQSKLHDIQLSMKHSPLGVWYDAEKSWVIVIGVLAIAGGAAGLYFTKTGGTVVDFPLSMIKGKTIPLWSIGSFSIAAKNLVFQPAQQKLGVEVIAEQKWRRLDASFGLGVMATNKQASQVNGEAIIKLPEFTATGGGTYDLMQRKLTLTLGFKPINESFDVTLKGIVTSGRATGGSLDASSKMGPVNAGTTLEDDAGNRKVMVFLRARF